MLTNELSVWDMQNKNSTEGLEAQHADSDQGQQLQQSEQSLAEQLKTFCDENGREKKPQESAKVIQQLGRVYRQRSPEKISLIRSAILFNGALVRKPDNVGEVEADLRELCAHVLQLADADDKSADLMSQASLIHRTVLEMRDVVGEVLKTLLPIPDEVFGDAYLTQVDELVNTTANIQDYIYRRFTSIMSKIMEFSVQVMGDAPCKYVLAGMGSLVTKEITPYSDFESFIVLEDGVQVRPDYKDILEYFRWVATIFQLILVNFGETVIYDAAIPSLNHPENDEDNWFYDAFTPCGISPDGFYPHASHNPLGRQDFTKSKPWKTELIKPVSEMLKYLNEDEDRKNGFHLSDVLTKFCFVSGDRDLYVEFDSSVKAKVVENGVSKSLIQQLKEDQQRFGVTKSLWCIQYNNEFDVKRAIYRSVTMSISALGQMHNFVWSSSFETVDKLSDLLPRNLRQKTKYAVAMACGVRLRTYLMKRSQDDHLKSGVYANSEYLSTLVDLLGARGACDFMTIVLGLQELAIKVFDLKFPFASPQDKDSKPLSQLFNTLVTSTNVVSSRPHSLRSVIDHADVTMRMMNYDYDTQAKLFPPEALMQRYTIRASYMLNLEQFFKTLEYCEKALAFSVPVPLSTRMETERILKIICYTYFQDDVKINEYLKTINSFNLSSFLDIPLDEISIDAWKRARHAKQSLVAEEGNEEMSSIKISSLRLMTLSVILKLMISNLKSLSTDPLSMVGLFGQAMNANQKDSTQKLFTAGKMMDGLFKIMQNKSSGEQRNLENEEKVDDVRSEEEHEQQEDEDQRTSEMVDLINQFSVSMGMQGNRIEDSELDKMKTVRSSLVRILRPALKVCTLGVTTELRKLKQLEEEGHTEKVPISYPTQAEFQALSTSGLSSMKRHLNNLAAKQKPVECQENEAHCSKSNTNSDFVEDDLD